MAGSQIFWGLAHIIYFDIKTAGTPTQSYFKALSI